MEWATKIWATNPWVTKARTTKEREDHMGEEQHMGDEHTGDEHTGDNDTSNEDMERVFEFQPGESQTMDMTKYLKGRMYKLQQESPELADAIREACKSIGEDGKCYHERTKGKQCNCMEGITNPESEERMNMFINFVQDIFEIAMNMSGRTLLAKRPSNGAGVPMLTKFISKPCRINR
mmetsp:Transcript_14295/g.31224  ORF Transcript_14295/g.31224 Transcript_14295/m.31224 type:complete len:178 (-) Transcript_14295:13-546(-)